MKTSRLFLVLVAVLGLATTAAAGDKYSIKTAVVAAKDAKVESFEWGQLMTYYSGDSYSTKDALTAVAIINPGMEIHPPHDHSEEEYLMVLEGNGTWTVNDSDFPAQAGDVLYAAPWDLHGIKNTGDTPLSFVVFKWNPKPVEPKTQKKKQ